MSNDSDYLFVWDASAPDGTAQAAALILENLEAHIGVQVYGKATVIDDLTLYWTCIKHVLPLALIVFPVPPDQIFERTSGDLFHRVIQ